MRGPSCRTPASAASFVLPSALSLVLAAGSAEAQEPPRRAPGPPVPAQPYVHEGFVYRSTTAARYNPLGLSSFFRLGYQVPLLGPQESVLLQRTYAGINALASITPAFVRAGGRVDIQPLAILQLSAAYEALGLFGTFDTLQSFARVSEDFSEERQAERGEAGLAYATTGSIFTAEAVLQGKVGPVVLVSTSDFIHTDMSVRGDDPFYLDLPLAILAAEEGWLFSNETDLLFLTSFGFGFGARHALYHSFLPAADVAGEEARAREITPIQFAGPVLIYQLFEEPGPARFNAPTFFLNVAWWIRNPYRTGQEIPQGVPYIAAGFTFRGEL